MSNPYYTHGSFPSTGAAATSASMRAELDLISAAFDKLPTLTSNANKFVVVNSTATGLTTTSTLPIASVNDSEFTFQDTADNTRKFQFAADAITPGATRLFTMPDADTTLVGTGTTQTLTNKTLTAPVIATIVNTGTLTLPTSTDTLVGRATTDTLTNKTLTNPTIGTILNTGTLTLPTSTDTLVGRATTDTLTNKTISGANNSLTNIGNSSLTNSAVTIGSSSLSLGGTLTTLAGVTISGASNTLSNIANASLTNSGVTFNGVTVALGASGTLTASTTNALTIGTGLQLDTGTTFNGGAARTLSIDSTVATLSGSQTLSNKTISGSSNTLSNIANSSLTNSSITIGSSSISLGSTASTISGLTSLSSTGLVMTANAASSTAISAIAQSAGTVTVTAAGHGLTSGDLVSIDSVADYTYCGLVTVNVTNANVFTYSRTTTTASSSGGYVTKLQGTWASYSGGTGPSYSGGPLLINASSQLPALRVTQGGNGYALIVEDAANPDTSAFIIANDGSLSISTNKFTVDAATGNTVIAGTLTLAGGINLNGNVTIGDASSDTLTVNSTITSNLIFTDNTYDIGASGATRPRSLYLGTNANVSGNANFGNGGSSTYGGYSTGGRVFSLAAAGGTVPAISASTDTTTSSTAFRAYTKEIANDTSYAFDIQSGNGTGVTTQKLQLTWGANGLWNSTALAVTGAVSASRQVLAQGTLQSYSGAGVFLSYESYGGRLEAYDYTGSAYQNVNIVPNGGNVGIGSTANTNKLYVYQGTAGNLGFTALHANGNSIQVAQSYNYYNAYNHVFSSLSGTTEYGRFLNTGNFGVGTTGPNAKLEVSIAGSTSGEIARFTSPSYDSVYIAAGQSVSSCGIGTLSSSAFNLFVNGSSKAVLTNGGYFGVGVSSPAANFDLRGSGVVSQYIISTSGSVQENQIVSLFNSGGGYSSLNLDGSNIKFRISGSNKVGIDSTGLGIGTMSPAGALDVTGRTWMRASGSSTVLTLLNTSGGDGSISATGTSNTMNYGFSTYHKSNALYIQDDGFIGINTTSPYAILESRYAFSGSTATTLGNVSQSSLYLSGAGYTNQYVQIAFGYDGTYAAAAIAFVPTNAAGQTKGDLLFATRDVTTSTLPTERARITSGGSFLVGTTSSGGDTSNIAPVVAGAFRTQYGVTSIASTGVATTVMTFNNNDGDFIVSMRGSGTGAPTTDDSVAIICVNAGNASQTNLKTGSNIVISMSGLNLQVTQSLFATANVSWSVMRISA